MLALNLCVFEEMNVQFFQMMRQCKASSIGHLDIFKIEKLALKPAIVTQHFLAVLEPSLYQPLSVGYSNYQRFTPTRNQPGTGTA
jgi:hypothetical protein